MNPRCGSADWPSADKHVESDPDFIDIWRIDLSNPDFDQRALLSSDECQRADKLVFQKDRDSFVRSRVCLRLILAQCLQCEANKIVFNYGEKGRPEISWPTSRDINFNLSHSGEIALIAVARNRRIGIDLGHLTRSSNWQGIAKRSFSKSEQSLLFALAEEDQPAGFHRIWTQKEAYTKAIGAGFSYGFPKFSVALDNRGTTGLLSDDKHPDTVDNWSIIAIDAHPDTLAALAYDGNQDVAIRQWQFSAPSPS